MRLADGDEEWEAWMGSLYSDDWDDDECKICGEPDCSGECWQHPPWYEDIEEGEGI